MCNINYVHGDVLHSLYNGASLVHCIGRDAKMGKGFALKVNALFKCKNDIRNQGKEVGEIATMQLGDGQYLFNLITKPFSSIPPDDTDGLLNCLMELRDLCDNLGVKHLSMPRIATGLDQIPWRLVQNMLQFVFGESNIKIDVYTLPLIRQDVDHIERGQRLPTTHGSMGECMPGKCNKDVQPSTTPRRQIFEASSLPVDDVWDSALPNAYEFLKSKQCETLAPNPPVIKTNAYPRKNSPKEEANLCGKGKPAARPPLLHIQARENTNLEMKELSKMFARFGRLDIRPYTSQKALLAAPTFVCAIDILHTMRTNPEVKVEIYEPIRHSRAFQMFVVSGSLLLMVGGLALLASYWHK